MLIAQKPFTSPAIRRPPPPKAWSLTWNMDQGPFANPIKAGRLQNRQDRRPVGSRPANEPLVFSPRRAIILVDLSATLAILPVPIIAPVLRRPSELLLSEVGAVTPK